MLTCQNVDRKKICEKNGRYYSLQTPYLVTFFYQQQKSKTTLFEFQGFCQCVVVSLSWFSKLYLRGMSRMTLIHGFYPIWLLTWKIHVWKTNESYFRRKQTEISGFEAEASHMRSERSTTELYPLIQQCIVIKDLNLWHKTYSSRTSILWKRSFCTSKVVKFVQSIRVCVAPVARSVSAPYL